MDVHEALRLCVQQRTALEAENESLRAKVTADAATIAMLGKALQEVDWQNRCHEDEIGTATHRTRAIREAVGAQYDPAVTRAIALDAARREVATKAKAMELGARNPECDCEQCELIDALARLAELEGNDGE